MSIFHQFRPFNVAAIILCVGMLSATTSAQAMLFLHIHGNGFNNVKLGLDFSPTDSFPSEPNIGVFNGFVTSYEEEEGPNAGVVIQQADIGTAAMSVLNNAGSPGNLTDSVAVALFMFQATPQQKIFSFVLRDTDATALGPNSSLEEIFDSIVLDPLQYEVASVNRGQGTITGTITNAFYGDTRITSVSEPATLGLFGLGLLGLGFSRRQRRRAL